MSDERKESRINIEDLQQEEKELSSEEARQVKGGQTGDGKLLGNLLTDAVADANRNTVSGDNNWNGPVTQKNK